MSGSLRVALLGCGSVGSEVARLVATQREDLAARVGAPVELAGIAVRRPGRSRPGLPIDPALFTLTLTVPPPSLPLTRCDGLFGLNPRS